MNQALVIDPGFAPAWAQLADVYLGQAVGFSLRPFGEDAELALQGLIECCAAGWTFQVATVYAFRDETDLAFYWLEQAYDNRDGGLVQMLHNPLLANLHDDPRWEPFLDKMGLPH